MFISKWYFFYFAKQFLMINAVKLRKENEKFVIGDVTCTCTDCYISIKNFAKIRKFDITAR